MYQKYRDGWLEVIAGCMFAGKTEELIRRIKYLEIAKKEIVAFKPIIDDRYSDTKIVSHDGTNFESNVIKKASEILDIVKATTEVVVIDEVQFLDDEICTIVDKLANSGIRVICAGLDTDFRGEPFGPMGKLLTQVEFVTKLTSVCKVCGNPATRTQRIINGEPASYYDPTILVGAAESYEARCRHCHVVRDKE